MTIEETKYYFITIERNTTNGMKSHCNFDDCEFILDSSFPYTRRNILNEDKNDVLDRYIASATFRSIYQDTIYISHLTECIEKIYEEDVTEQYRNLLHKTWNCSNNIGYCLIKFVSSKDRYELFKKSKGRRIHTIIRDDVDTDHLKMIGTEKYHKVLTDQITKQPLTIFYGDDDDFDGSIRLIYDNHMIWK